MGRLGSLASQIRTASSIRSGALPNGNCLSLTSVFFPYLSSDGEFLQHLKAIQQLFNTLLSASSLSESALWKKTKSNICTLSFSKTRLCSDNNVGQITRLTDTALITTHYLASIIFSNMTSLSFSFCQHCPLSLLCTPAWFFHERAIDCIKYGCSLCDVTHRFLKSCCEACWVAPGRRHLGSIELTPPNFPANPNMGKEVEHCWS